MAAIPQKDPKLTGAIRRAIQDGNLEQMLKLLDNHPEALKMEGSFGPWLHVAAMYGRLPVIKELLKRGVDLQATGGIGEWNALYDAVRNNQYEAAVYLLDQGIAMELPGRPNKSPLFAAILGDRVKMLQLLIDRGIDTEPDNWDPIYEAKRESAARCLTLLEKVKAEKWAGSKDESP
jgi:ankyrin repeat protein